MLSVALNERTVCNDFDLEKEILFFKIGSEGLVSFHGNHFSRKVQVSFVDQKQLAKTKGYFPISSNCFVNAAKVKAIISGSIYFGGDFTSSKMLPISKRVELKLSQFLQHS